jgi:coenzyme F420-reducing hydrogenase alpha subunit
MTPARTIRVEALARVEGEGGLFVRLEGDKVVEARLDIYEPPRLFERLLLGKPLEEVPDITARICGICPVAYQMSTVHSLEAALGVQISPGIRRLRRLLYCGEWIESHALHIHMLHAPDFLGYAGGVEMAAAERPAVERGLRLKKYGNRLLEVLGGRAVHPINVAVGGFYRIPRREESQALIPDLQWGFDAALAAARWVGKFEFPDAVSDGPMVALQPGHEYPMNEGPLAIGTREPIAARDFERHFAESQVPHSTALHSRLIEGDQAYLVGPLARVAHNRAQLLPEARQMADEIGLAPGCRNPFKSILARAVELVHAFGEALDIVRTFEPFTPGRVTYEHRAGSGCAATEAPRGMLYHRLEFDEKGRITFAKIVPPTSQNQAQIERDLRAWLPQWRGQSDLVTASACERLVRSYDPCISCSTHFLKTTIQRD